MLTKLLRDAKQRHPHKTAIVHGSRRISYEQLVDLCAQTAGGLRKAGVQASDCVAMVAPNSPEWIVSFFACVALRAIVLPLNPQSTAQEIRRFLEDTKARFIIMDEASAAEWRHAPANAQALSFSEAGDGPSFEPADEFRGPALYLYTSGSTSTFKRVCCTHENLYFEAHNFVESMGLTAQDNILCTIPLFHSYGIGNCLLDAVYQGSTLVLDDGRVPFAARCADIAAIMRREQIRFFPAVPYQFATLAAMEAGDLGVLNLCVSSGDVLPEHTYRRFIDRFGIPIRSLYGSTEAGSISIDRRAADAVVFGSLGPPLKNVSAQIRAEGHIWVKSPVIPDELRGPDGYYNTGDIGRIDDSGYLVMLGRKQSFIETGGRKVDVAEVEEVLERHPKIREAAVLGMHVPELGILVKAVVATTEPVSDLALAEHCRRHLAGFKIPRIFECCESLPRSPLGKVLKSELSSTEQFVAGLPPTSSATELETITVAIEKQAAVTLQCDPASLSRDATFEGLGFDSLRAAEFRLRLERWAGQSIPITMVWNHPSIEQLASAIMMLKANANLGFPEAEIQADIPEAVTRG